MQVRQLSSPDEVRSVAAAWDRLWQRSAVSQPLVRAELVAQWLEHFRPGADTRVLVVEDGSELLAALPLVIRRHGGILPVGDLTSNPWSTNGDLLLDPCGGLAPVVLLAKAINRLPWPLLWLNEVPVDTPYWQAILQALPQAGARYFVSERYRIGQTKIGGTWDCYETQRSKSLRRSIRKHLRRLEQHGPVELKVIAQFMPKDVDHWLREAFEIEDRSWKRNRGQTVLRTPRMFDFYCRQARQLAAWGSLRIAFLEQAGRRLAFQVGWQGKRVYHSCKVGFDETYREFGPGQLLRMQILHYLFQSSDIDWIDFQGPLMDAQTGWITQTYPIGRVVVAAGSVTSRSLLAAYQVAAPTVRFLRRHLSRSHSS